MPVDIDALWEYSDPAGSEQRFRAALGGAAGDDELELLTQIARTHSLRSQFEEAYAILDAVEGRLEGAGPAPRVRALLERGRTLNSAARGEEARPLFVAAWEKAVDAGIEGLAVDAAHMVAIVDGRPDGEWARRGMALARTSPDAKARSMLPALLNNAAWDLFEAGRPADALPLFEEARREWLASGREPQGRIARWSVARCLRSLGRHREALAAQRELEREWGDDPNGYVFEEIAELLLAMGRTAEAGPYFARAARLLGEDEWLSANQPERLQRLRTLGR